jgi:predicted Zn-dependent peptidase
MKIAKSQLKKIIKEEINEIKLGAAAGLGWGGVTQKEKRAEKEADAEELRQVLGNDWQVNVRMLEDRYQLTVNKQSWAGADYTPEEVEEADVQDIASKFGVDASVEITDDGSPVIVVHLPGGETATYNDSDEMYKELADEIGRDIHGDPDRYEDEY